ncbi:MAG: CHASE2 domain-containing protein [Cyanobacteria bacterium P01_A01_bin.40]
MRWQPPTIAILIACLTAAAFNSLGWLQISERQLYDYYLRSRPLEPQDKKIVIVGITEKDIEQLGFPISDDTLASLLTKIKAQNPRTIGLDLHRNVNIGESGNQKLDKIFSSTPQLIGVEKTDGGNPSHLSISPPTQLRKLGQTGASEIIEDSENGVVRRGYLYVQKSTEEEPIPSLGLAVALKYLEGENIFPTGYGEQSWLKLNDAVFPLLEANRLFYSEQAIDNYQTVINYCNNKDKFLHLSISEVLANKVEDNLFKDKIVFIGTMAETIEDIYTTPYSYRQENYDFTYGVEIHASMTSQIVNAALNDRVIIKFLPIYWQYAGLFILLLTTSFSSWCLYTKNNFFPRKKIVVHIIYSIFSLIIVLIIGYLLLLVGWWIPTATVLLIALSSELCTYVFLRLDLLKQENFILEQKVEERTRALREAQKKILSQEKLALYQKLAQYIAHEIKNKTNIIGLNLENSQTDIDELQLIIEDNSFLFEEITDPRAQSPQEIIFNLNNKLSKIKSINQKVTLIINEIYQRGSDNNGKDTSMDTDVDLNHLINSLLSDAIQISKLKYQDFKIVIERNYDKNLTKLSCTTSKIERAFDNIITNAIYHLDRKAKESKSYQPKLSIFTQNKSNSVEIKIRDNGMGIPAENLDKIFQIFWTTKTNPEGMGLGLHFTKEIIEKHGGKISVDSIEGEYTEFIVTLPT